MGLNFEIVKPVVALKSHSQGVFKEGEIFKLLAMQQSLCNCKFLVLYVGHSARRLTKYCSKCGAIVPCGDNRMFFNSVMFAPLDDMHEAECAFAELMEEVEVCEPVLV
jgi:hypothetical protein